MTVAERDVLAARGLTQVGRGHCSERQGGTEAYLPVIDALGNLLRTEASESVARLMKATAPTWYAQVAGGRQRKSGTSFAFQ